MNYLPQFKIWLAHQGYSESTARNYLADLGKYLEYINHLPQVISLNIPSSPEPVEGHILSPTIVGLYVAYLSGKMNSPRYLASLNKFCQFALDQQLISQNPLKTVHRSPRQPELTDLVTLYETHLIKHNTPTSTIRNYINDLNQYISWLSNPSVSSVTETSPLDRGDLKQIQKRKLFNFWPPLSRSLDTRRVGGGRQAGGV